MEKGDMRVPRGRGVRSIPERMIAREPTVVRISLVDEDQPAGRSRVPRVRRNHVQSGSQLCLERLIHALCSTGVSSISPLANFRHHDAGEISFDSAPYDGTSNCPVCLPSGFMLTPTAATGSREGVED